jgi:dTDP-4-dehydrorhamnose reductase
VDQAESQESLARAVNADQPRAVAQACGIRNIPLVHVSTDYVFDGAKEGAYVEADAPSPINAYGRSKLAGDRYIESEATAPWAILRTSWVFSEAADSFPAKILNRALSGEPLRVVDDQVGCPTPAASLASAMQAIGQRLLDRDRNAQGLFNYCGAQPMSWYGFATRLIDCALKAGMERPDMRPISSDEFPAAAKRPRNSVLDCSKIARDCNIAAARIDAEIDRVAQVILAHQSGG